MSDAMSHREIEDVLTSIRRLVAQEGGRSHETGRLILTEAQRVNGAPGVSVPELSMPEVSMPEVSMIAVESAGPALPEPDFGRLEATIAELEAAVSASGDGWEPEAEASTPKASNVTELYGRLSFSHRGREVQLPDAPKAEPKAAAPVSAPVVTVAAPEAEARAGETGSTTAEPAGDVADVAPVGATFDEAPVVAPAGEAAPVDEMSAGAAEGAADVTTGDMTIGALAAPEAPVAEAARVEPARVEPEVRAEAAPAAATPVAEAARPAAMAQDMVSEVEHAYEPEPEAYVETGPEAVSDREDGIEAVLDEEMLRALVAQIVREELHGQLGERITLQVRKLVRAEIAKALDERKFL